MRCTFERNFPSAAAQHTQFSDKRSPLGMTPPPKSTWLAAARTGDPRASVSTSTSRNISHLSRLPKQAGDLHPPHLPNYSTSRSCEENFWTAHDGSRALLRTDSVLLFWGPPLMCILAIFPWMARTQPAALRRRRLPLAMGALEPGRFNDCSFSGPYLWVTPRM